MDIQDRITILLRKHRKREKRLWKTLPIWDDALIRGNHAEDETIVIDAHELPPAEFTTRRRDRRRRLKDRLNSMRDIQTIDARDVQHLLTETTHRDRRDVRLPAPGRDVHRNRRMINRNPRSDLWNIRPRITLKNIDIIKRDQQRIKRLMLMRPRLHMRRNDIIRMNIKPSRVLPDPMPVEGRPLKAIIRCDSHLMAGGR